MTRLASIVGVATVATLVLLSGCESAVKTDYAKNLAGTWKVTLMGVANPMPPPPPMIPGTTEVTAKILRTDTNKGTVSLEITGTPTAAPALAATTTVMGNIEVTADKITVSDIGVMPMTAVAGLPGGAGALAQGLTLTYDLSDDGSELEVTNDVLFAALLGPSNTKLTLTKQ